MLRMIDISYMRMNCRDVQVIILLQFLHESLYINNGKLFFVSKC